MPKVKHRHSKARGRKRRTHDKLDAPSVSKCDQCGKPKRPHYVCPHCGYYGGTQVKSWESLEERKERREKKGKQP
ncbi:MAG: 50S ribosomal protein L32 [Candidatus Omnitrophota bacterium]